MIRVFCAIGATCWLALSAIALAEAPSEAPRRSLLVQRIQTSGVEKDAALVLEEAIVLELGQRRGVHVVTPAELEQTLRFAQMSIELGCDSNDACLAEVRDKLSVQTVLTGRLGTLGKDMFLTLSSVDAKSGSVTKRATIEGEDVEALRRQTGQLADQLLDDASARVLFSLPAGETLKLAVMPLSARGVSESTADAMTQILSAELNQIEGVGVISRDDIRAMLDKTQLEAEVGCTDNLACIVEIGAALGLSKLVAGSVGKIGESYVISIQLIDTREAQVDNRVLEAFVGAEGELRNAVKVAAYQLVGVPYAERRGALKLAFNVDGADVRLGERAFRVRDSRLDVPDLSPGRYSLQVRAEDFNPFQTDVYVAPDAANVQTIELSARPTRWYKSWWFWTTTGVMVAGTGALSAYFLTRSEVGNGSGTATITGGP